MTESKSNDVTIKELDTELNLIKNLVIKQGIGLIAIAMLIVMVAILLIGLHQPGLEPSTSTVNNPPEVLASKSEQIEVVKRFDSGIQGVTGWVVQVKGQSEETRSIVYTLADKYLLAGNIMEGTDINHTIEHMKTYAPESYAVNIEGKPSKITGQGPSKDAQQSPEQIAKQYAIDYSKIESIYRDQPKVSIGSGEKRITVLVDLNCPYCHAYYKQILANINEFEGVTFDFIPVGLLGMESVNKAALFDGKSDQAKAALLESMMNRVQVLDQPTNDAAGKSMARTQAWGDAGLSVVPLTVVNIDSRDGQISIPGSVDTMRLKALINQIK